MLPRIPWNTTVSLLFVAVLVSVTSCQKSDGPLERAGEAMDEAIDDAGDKMGD